MKKLGTLLLACITALNLWAEEFKIGKLTFEIETPTTVGLIDADADIRNVFLSETIDYKGKSYTLTYIGDYAFSVCSSLTSVTIPNSVTSIGGSAFRNCESLTSVTIPNSVTSIGEWAFSGCSSLRSPIYNVHCFAFMPTSYSGAYTIPNSIKEIAGGAFRDCSALTSVTIPNSVTSIGEEVFEGTAFYNNPANWENGALYINNCLIKVADGFTGHFRIKENTRVIADEAFAWCESLTSVTIPNSVTSIGDEAFEGCKSLTSVTIPNSVTSIGGEAFDDCTSLTSVTIPNSVTSIGAEAFEGCKSLTSVTIPNSVTSIGVEAFGSCSSLKSVTIPNSVTSIGLGAFKRTALYNNPANWKNGALYIDDCLIKVDEGFAGHFRIKENTRVIADEAFEYCSSLTSVTIPNSVTSIGEGAFPSHIQIIRR